jgi:hypothetical protein
VAVADAKGGPSDGRRGPAAAAVGRRLSGRGRERGGDGGRRSRGRREGGYDMCQRIDRTSKRTSSERPKEPCPPSITSRPPYAMVAGARKLSGRSGSCVHSRSFVSNWNVALPAAPVPPVTYMQLPVDAAADHLLDSGPTFTGRRRSHAACAEQRRAKKHVARAMKGILTGITRRRVEPQHQMMMTNTTAVEKGKGGRGW